MLAGRSARQPASLLAIWMNSLGLPSRAFDEAELHRAFRDGQTLVEILKRLSPEGEAELSAGVLKRCPTAATAVANIERGLRFVWRANPRASSMPTALELHATSPRETVLRFVDELFCVYALRPARRQHGEVLGWADAVLARYGRGLSRSSLGPPFSTLSIDLRSGTSLACLLHHWAQSAGLEEEGADSHADRSAGLDGPRAFDLGWVFFEPEDGAELAHNLGVVRPLLALCAPVRSHAACLAAADSVPLLLVQLRALYRACKGALPAADWASRARYRDHSRQLERRANGESPFVRARAHMAAAAEARRPEPLPASPASGGEAGSSPLGTPNVCEPASPCSGVGSLSVSPAGLGAGPLPHLRSSSAQRASAHHSPWQAGAGCEGSAAGVEGRSMAARLHAAAESRVWRRRAGADEREARGGGERAAADPPAPNGQRGSLAAAAGSARGARAERSGQLPPVVYPTAMVSAAWERSLRAGACPRPAPPALPSPLDRCGLPDLPARLFSPPASPASCGRTGAAVPSPQPRIASTRRHVSPPRPAPRERAEGLRSAELPRSPEAALLEAVRALVCERDVRFCSRGHEMSVRLYLGHEGEPRSPGRKPGRMQPVHARAPRPSAPHGWRRL